MPNKNSFQVLIDGKDYTRHVVFPIKWSKLLDERLDETRLTLKNLSENIIHPLTPLTVTFTDKNGKEVVLHTVVTTDEAEEVPVGSGKYDHEIMCLEETKILEGIVVDALTFTNSLLYQTQDNYSEPIAPNKIKENLLSDAKGLVEIISDIERLYIPPLKDLYEFKADYELKYDIFVYNSWDKNLNNSEDLTSYIESLSYHNEVAQSVWDIDEFTIRFAKNGYKNGNFLIRIRWSNGGTFKFSNSYIDYYFTLYETPPDPPKDWTIATVIDRVLDVAEPHLFETPVRFSLNQKQHDEFNKIKAPEFAFTNATLKEILDQIGGYIHGIPRLRGNEIYFDMLGGTEQAEIANYPYISNVYSQDIESYCTSLDSSVDNMVCLTDSKQGTVIDPIYNGERTVRTETAYARVEDKNMYIETQYGIQELICLENTYIDGKSYIAGDITQFVVEKARYNMLSAYSNTYPTSKSHALYYTQGEKNIRGLNFKANTITSELTGGAYENYAIINIINVNTGKQLDSTTYPLLAFRVTYIPIFSARTQQTKQYIGEYKQPRTLVYNQGANLVETRHYGENMKGAVARMGNVDRTVMYNLPDLGLVPEAGQLFGDDYYISGVTCELYPDFVKCMLSLSQYFNRLSQYIGINSTRRFYEVSEKAAYRRDIKYADYVVIGDAIEPDFTLSNMLPIVGTFNQNTDEDYVSVSCAMLQGDTNQTIMLPVVSTAQGNAMVFTCAMQDNYSAGIQVQHQQDGKVDGYFTNTVPYADYYGRIALLNFYLFGNRTQMELDEALRFPEWNKTLRYTGTPYVGTFYNGLVVHKDGAEILSLNYIVEFVTNKRNIIIGSALARNCPMVRGSDAKLRPKLYILQKRIDKLTSEVDIKNATEVQGWKTFLMNNDKTIRFDNCKPTADGVAWAFVSYNELLFGCNEIVTNNVEIKMPYMTLRHNIFNL